ncbi:helix-turn-helix DNA binding domain protein [Streptomyces phage Muntaha]|uniref:Helix-turn-helix DNA binding domain protein n=1 Tax=Streptomyces phage Muntaha TaxID=2713269 RepID=A0A6G8R356_9CAUD|nr:helix-turn-helix DNA binding domain protein [Streptomyces phage Muntaha]QIN94606.1 helix-turn-helix DNA binding domain protein [Streptomyces phage Muntaha]
MHRVLSTNRAQDLVVTWHFKEGKRRAYVWSDARRRLGKAFTMGQVSKMINRHRVIIEKYILDGKIRAPERIYTLDGTKRPGKYMFSEKDVLELHDYLLTVHIGRPRKDGKITPGRMPSRAELKAMMQHDTTMYVKSADGTFTPVWKEMDW